MNVGFIGCGRIAHFHADVLKELDVNILAVSARDNSPSLISFAEKFDIENKYTNWETMVERESLDVLWVMASWNKMDSLLIPLIKTRIPLFLEKPIALSSKRIRDAIKIHAGINQYIQVGYNRRFYPFVEKMKSIILNGELRSVLVEIPESINLNNKKLVSKLWFVNSSHILDLLYYFVGPMTIKYKSLNNYPFPTSFHAIMETINHTPVHLISEWNTSGNLGITFYVDNKQIVIKPLEKVKVFQGYDLIEASDNYPINQYQPKVTAEYDCGSSFKPGFYEQLNYFLDNYKPSNKKIKHADLNQCLYLTLLIEKLLE